MINAAFILTIIASIILIKICYQKKLFLDYKIEKHKRLTSRINNFSIGGIIFFFFYFFLFLLKNEFDLIFMLSLTLIFFIGFFSDLKFFKSAVLRFFLQILVLIYFIVMTNTAIPLSNIYIFDLFLSNEFANRLFTIFCLMILINGNNFIDGINTLLIGNSLVVCFFLMFFFTEEISYTSTLFNYLIIILFLLFLNFRGTIILGDAGSYLLAFVLGTFLIDLAKNNQEFSPFFIISLIWYPCYELLFSILRRLRSNTKTYKPDTEHLHQLFYLFFINNRIKNQRSHLLVSIIINGYCLLSFILNYILGYKNITVIIFLIVNISIYMFFYYFLKNYHKINAKF